MEQSRQYPKWKFPADGSSGRIVNDAHEEDALGGAWLDEPIPDARGGELTLIAHLVASPTKTEETKQFLLSLVGKSRAEPGCLDYDLYQSIENPSEFTFFETFGSRAAWDSHMKQPYIMELAKRSDELLLGTPQIRLVTMISQRK